MAIRTYAQDYAEEMLKEGYNYLTWKQPNRAILSAESKDVDEFIEKLFSLVAKRIKEDELGQSIDDATGTVQEIKNIMKYFVVKNGLQGLAQNAWFEASSISETSNPETTRGVQTIDTATLAGEAIGDPRNWKIPIPSWKSSGNIGSFWETQFFGGGAGSDPYPDITLKSGVDVEIKTIFGEIIGDLDLGSYKSGKIGFFYKGAAGSGEKPDYEKIAQFYKALVLEKYMEKAPNLLIALVDTNKNKKKFTLVEGMGWVKSYQFRYRALYYYHRLLIKALLELLDNEISVEKVIEQKSKKASPGVPLGSERYASSLFKSGANKGKLEFDIAIKAPILPSPKDIEKKIEENRATIYAAIHVLFDDSSPDGVNTAEKFFEDLLGTSG